MKKPTLAEKFGVYSVSDYYQPFPVFLRDNWQIILLMLAYVTGISIIIGHIALGVGKIRNKGVTKWIKT